MKNWLPRKWRLKVPARVAAALRALPFLMLVFVVVVGVRQLAFNLVSLEPFHAYLFRVAGWATIAIAVVGLVASLFVPMAYCRYGCPTGGDVEFSMGRRAAGEVFASGWARIGLFGDRGGAASELRPI